MRTSISSDGRGLRDEMVLRVFAVALALPLIVWWSSGSLTLAEHENHEHPRQSIERSGSNCPGYRPGVGLRSRPLRECVTGSAAGRVDHEVAFGFRGTDVDLRDCDLPEYPETK